MTISDMIELNRLCPGDLGEFEIENKIRHEILVVIKETVEDSKKNDEKIDEMDKNL